MGKLQYRTKQMTELLTFLESVKGRHVTVNEICDALAQKGIAIGTTTVYRHLERLVEDGTVAKYVVDGTSSACFEYMGEHSSIWDMMSIVINIYAFTANARSAEG